MRSTFIGKRLPLFVLLLCVRFCCHAQLTFEYEIQKRASIDPINNFDTLYDWSCILQLDDTLTVSKIHFKMGTAPGSSNVFEREFNYDEGPLLPAHLRYRRDSNQVNIGFGNYLDRNYYIEVKLEDTSGTFSPVQAWNNL